MKKCNIFKQIEIWFSLNIFALCIDNSWSTVISWKQYRNCRRESYSSIVHFSLEIQYHISNIVHCSWCTNIVHCTVGVPILYTVQLVYRYCTLYSWCTNIVHCTVSLPILYTEDCTVGVPILFIVQLVYQYCTLHSWCTNIVHCSWCTNVSLTLRFYKLYNLHFTQMETFNHEHLVLIHEDIDRHVDNRYIGHR